MGKNRPEDLIISDEELPSPKPADNQETNLDDSKVPVKAKKDKKKRDS